VIKWGFLGAAFVGTGIGFLAENLLPGVGWGSIVAGVWCFVVGLLRTDVGTNDE